jgi:5-oxoprolinase (ATP-hydrolysing)
MSFAVVYQLAKLGPSLRPGDVLLANSPIAGGSHLPDLTVITPVFSQPTEGSSEQPKIIFFTASRGHHADIGGAQPGSMPSYSTSLAQEGAEIIKLVDAGKYDRDGLYKLLVEDPAKIPGCSGCRDFRSVESDLKAVSHTLLHPRMGIPSRFTGSNDDEC